MQVGQDHAPSLARAPFRYAGAHVESIKLGDIARGNKRDSSARRIGRGCGVSLLALALGCGAARADESIVSSAEEAEVPRVRSIEAEAGVRAYGLGDGRFLVIAPAGGEGQSLARLSEVAWTVWRDPLGLPAYFTAPITVRLVTGTWSFPERDWKVLGEAGGVVTLWIRGGGEPNVAQRRRWLTALAEGALYRRAVWLGVELPRLTVPRWLAIAAAEAALIHENPALLDAWQQEVVRGGRLPSLRWTLTGALSPTAQVELVEDTSQRLAAYGAWRWLQQESARSSAWGTFVADLLGGVAPGAALVRAYGPLLGRTEAAEIELAWQVGVAAAARARTLPLLGAAESRARLFDLDRLAVREATGGNERVVLLSELWAERNDDWVISQREVRLRWLTSNHPRIHPFYRNAAGSLGRILSAQRDGQKGDWDLAVEYWREDVASGLGLEQGSRALLAERP